MDVIAGELGFLPDLLKTDGREEISFEFIERIRSEFCPQASCQASLIGIVKALPAPCVLLEAGLRLKKSEESAVLQAGSQHYPRPVPALRAIHVTLNQAARDAGMQMHPCWRVPKKSAIYRAFKHGEYAEATENLDWWATSNGSQLASCAVLVKARPSGDGVTALLIPDR